MERITPGKIVQNQFITEDEAQAFNEYERRITQRAKELKASSFKELK